MEELFVIDKVYEFYAVGSGVRDEVSLHVQLGHDDVWSEFCRGIRI